MATKKKQSHKQKHQLHRPLAQQFPTGTIPTGTPTGPLNVGNYAQQIQDQTARTLPIFDLQQQAMLAQANNQIAFQLYQLQFGNTLGALNIGANPIQLQATNFGVGNFA
jgi:hypothetical protein